jgi:hypothetical protein
MPKPATEPKMPMNDERMAALTRPPTAVPIA